MGLSVKGQSVNGFGSAGHMISVITAQLYSVKSAIDNILISKCGCVPIKLLLTGIGYRLDLDHAQ